MNRGRREGDWTPIKGSIKEQWGTRTDDLDVINGRRDPLEGKLRERYGCARDQASAEIDIWYIRRNWLP